VPGLRRDKLAHPARISVYHHPPLEQWESGLIAGSDDFPGYQLGVLRAQAASNRWWAGAAYPPVPGVGYLLRRSAGFTWVPGPYHPKRQRR
jgi:hypothetical protein